MTEVTLADVEKARDRMTNEDVVRRTPIEPSRSLSDVCGGDVTLKMEHLQRTGSFKTRGAYNKLSQLAERGDVERVVAASAGNHAQGVALAATTFDIPSTIVMPTTAPQTKVDATRDYGATVELVGSNFAEAMDHARSIAGDPGVAFVHAYDDPDIVAGQGTLGLEIAEQIDDLDTVVVPIGGGGLISGVATALKGRLDDVRVVGVQAAEAATVPESLDKGIPVDHPDPNTIADGIATGGISELTLDIIAEHVDEVVTVSDDEIARATLAMLERAKQVVEGAGAASVAALLTDDLDVAGERVVPILCGGNIDMSALQEVITHALEDRSQLLTLRVRIEDRPGRLAEISDIIAEHGGNVRSVRHDRAVEDLSIGEAYLVFEVVASGREHTEDVLRSIEDAGYEVERLTKPV
ncbi:threonine ammonia-lyase [Haloparvum sp. PAK95]|uniref:threonine ammonia-lyase n=1 Tax=Haloparvum sp. PAK95 TaxID=3418962 RepID=UPI003D2EBBEB